MFLIACILFGIEIQLRQYGFTFITRDWSTVFFYTMFLIVVSNFLVGAEWHPKSDGEFSQSVKNTNLFTFGVFVLAYVLMFGTKGYGQIPMRFGGGRPVEVRLLLTEEGARHLGSVYEVTSNGSAITDPVALLLETDDAYVLLVGASAVSVQRDLVSLAVYLPDRRQTEKPGDEKENP